MVRTFTLAEHLAGLDRQELQTLLALRPETIDAWEIRDLADVAEVWGTPWSMSQSIPDLPLPAIETLHTLAALVPGVTVGQLSERLQQSGTLQEHQEHVLSALRILQHHGLAWVGQDGGIWVSQDLDQMITRPLGLGCGVERKVRYLTVDVLRGILSHAGLENGGKRADVVRRVFDLYLDADRILALVAGAPVEVQQDLAKWASGESPFTAHYDRENMMRVQASFRWFQVRGLLFGSSGFEVEVPAPVAMALRGKAFRAPFHPLPPDLPATEARPHQVSAAGGAAATNFGGLSMSVLDAVETRPLPLLAKGGVGIRELTKLAERTKSGSDEVRIVIELGFAAELLVRRDSHLVTGRGFARWRSAEPVDRVAELLAAWWTLSYVPSAHRNSEGKPQPALAISARGGQFAEARQRGVQMLAELQRPGPDLQAAGTDRGAFAARLSWERPVAAGTTGVVAQAIWDEAHLLGVLADGACTPAGRALLTLDGDLLQQGVRGMMPTAATTASFGSDLTVMVAGAPSAAVAELLDECAERESRGAASLWRLSPSGVRRAMDNGWGAVQLTAALQRIASAPLPQPVTYLISDVARRHGHVQVAPAGCCVVSEDAALLVELCAARALGALGLRLITPTVVVSNADSVTTLAELRAAGYMPVVQDFGAVGVLPSSGPFSAGLLDLEASGGERVVARQRIDRLLAPQHDQSTTGIQRKVADVVGRIFRERPRTLPPVGPTLFP